MFASKSDYTSIDVLFCYSIDVFFVIVLMYCFVISQGRNGNPGLQGAAGPNGPKVCHSYSCRYAYYAVVIMFSFLWITRSDVQGRGICSYIFMFHRRTKILFRDRVVVGVMIKEEYIRAQNMIYMGKQTDAT
jgi:hypothetical protein